MHLDGVGRMVGWGSSWAPGWSDKPMTKQEPLAPGRACHVLSQPAITSLITSHN